MKTKEELNAIKKEVEALNKKLAELTDEELAQISSGAILPAHIHRLGLVATVSDDHPLWVC